MFCSVDQSKRNSACSPGAPPRTKASSSSPFPVISEDVVPEFDDNPVNDIEMVEVVAQPDEEIIPLPPPPPPPIQV